MNREKIKKLEGVGLLKACGMGAKEDTKMIKELQDIVLPMYLQNHPDSKLNHLFDIADQCLRLALFRGLTSHEIKIAYICGMVHDAFVSDEVDWEKRAESICSSPKHWFEVFSHKYGITYLESIFIKTAIEECRAHYTDEWSTVYSEILSSAKRKVPDLNDIITKMNNRELEGIDYSKLDITSQVMDKYNLHNGRVRYPQLFKEYHGEDLLEFDTTISDHNKFRLRYTNYKYKMANLERTT